MRYYTLEHQHRNTINIKQHMEAIQADNLKDALNKALQKQIFQNTVIKLFDEDRRLIAINETEYKKGWKYYETV